MVNWEGLCRGCKYWQCDAPGQYVFGFCKRYPPDTQVHIATKRADYGQGIEVTINDTAIPKCPNTKEDDWCGEWSARSSPLP